MKISNNKCSELSHEKQNKWPRSQESDYVDTQIETQMDSSVSASASKDLSFLGPFCRCKQEFYERYTGWEAVGSGGQATVYRAYDVVEEK